MTWHTYIALIIDFIINHGPYTTLYLLKAVTLFKFSYQSFNRLVKVPNQKLIKMLEKHFHYKDGTADNYAKQNTC